MEIFQLSNVLWKFFHRLFLYENFQTLQFFCGNFHTNQCFVEVRQKKTFLWKLANTAIFCGNLATKQIISEGFPTQFLISSGKFSTKQYFVGMF